MRLTPGSSHRLRAAAIGAVALLVTLQAPLGALAATLVQLSSDPYHNTASQHATQVEPDNYSYGSTIVMATQTGRIFGGGAANIGWATSTDGGATWTHGFLPGTTVYATPKGNLAAVSDPAVAYDAAHRVWIIASLPLTFGSGGPGAIVSRSTDGGLTWDNPVTVTNQSNTDKTWIVCDDTSSSPYYGHCYVEWDNPGSGQTVYMSTSTDGGKTWGPALATANRATGLGGQPLVQPNGTVIVPVDDASGASQINSFSSTNGGQSWSATVKVARITSHTDPGGLRSGPLPSAEIDGAGKVYVVWEDCRFETGCSANDLVYVTSTNGTTWSKVHRIPIDPKGSGVDHFLPGIAVDKSTSGANAHLALVYYYYPNVNCTTATCQLNVGFVSSTNGGRTWSASTHLAGPMKISWLPNTFAGPMVGDYMSTTIANGMAFPAFEIANAKSGSTFDESLYTATGLSVTGGDLSAEGDQPVPGATGDRIVTTPIVTAN